MSAFNWLVEDSNFTLVETDPVMNDNYIVTSLRHIGGAVATVRMSNAQLLITSGEETDVAKTVICALKEAICDKLNLSDVDQLSAVLPGKGYMLLLYRAGKITSMVSNFFTLLTTVVHTNEFVSCYVDFVKMCDGPSTEPLPEDKFTMRLPSGNSELPETVTLSPEYLEQLAFFFSDTVAAWKMSGDILTVDTEHYGIEFHAVYTDTGELIPITEYIGTHRLTSCSIGSGGIHLKEGVLDVFFVCEHRQTALALTWTIDTTRPIELRLK